jgi:hypothetical protein
MHRATAWTHFQTLWQACEGLTKLLKFCCIACLQICKIIYTQDQLDARIAQCAAAVPGNYCTGGEAWKCMVEGVGEFLAM